MFSAGIGTLEKDRPAFLLLRFPSSSEQQRPGCRANNAVRCESVLSLKCPDQQSSRIGVDTVRIARQPLLLERQLNLNHVWTRKKGRCHIQQPVCRVIGAYSNWLPPQEDGLIDDFSSHGDR